MEKTQLHDLLVSVFAKIYMLDSQISAPGVEVQVELAAANSYWGEVGLVKLLRVGSNLAGLGSSSGNDHLRRCFGTHTCILVVCAHHCQRAILEEFATFDLLDLEGAAAENLRRSGKREGSRRHQGGRGQEVLHFE